MPYLPFGYDIAQICLNGHVITSGIDTYPNEKKSFCDRCGERTIINCENKSCNSGWIRGLKESEPNAPYLAPNHCRHCGSSFPWFERKREAANKLIEEHSKLSSEDKQLLMKSIDEIIKDTPETMVATERFKRLIVKMGKETAKALRDIVVDIASESAKRML